MSKNIEFIPIKENNLQMILDWRNAPEVRENMYTSHEISITEHKRWFDCLEKDNSKAYFIATINGTECGVVGFSEINSVKGVATWAFYCSPNALRGSGSLMEFFALEYAFNKLHLHKLRCEVLSFNKAVVKLHTKFGFIIEGQHRDAFYRDEKYHDIIHLGIMENEWKEHRTTMQKKLRIS